LALFAAAYIAAGRLGLLLAFANENATAVWPATGLAGHRDWRVHRQLHQLSFSHRVADHRGRKYA
jgi:hypothetical protein